MCRSLPNLPSGTKTGSKMHKTCGAAAKARKAPARAAAAKMSEKRGKNRMLWNDYTINLMQGGLDGLALQQQMILQNLANADTPGYKAKSVSFENILANTSGAKNGDYAIRATVYEENDPMRPDENTVDADKESILLTQNYIQQMAMYNKISESFSNMRYVFNQFTK